jgi:hypothetical protein
MITHRLPLILALLAAAGCATNMPPQERGFFEAIGAAATGEDVARDRRLQEDAATAERRAAEMRARLDVSQREANASSAAVGAAEARLRQLDAEIATLRRRAAALPQTGDAAQRAEAERLRRDAEALERERRAAASAPGGASDAALERLRERARALGQALDRQQRI